MSQVSVGAQQRPAGRSAERDNLEIVLLERARLGAQWVEPGTVIAHVRPEGVSAAQLNKALVAGLARVRPPAQ